MAAEAKLPRHTAHLPSWPLPSVVTVDSRRYGLASWFQPRAATYTFWNAERAPISSAGLGAVSAGLLCCEVQALSSASRMSVAPNHTCVIPSRNELCFQPREKVTPNISARGAVGSVGVRPTVFMASFLL